MVAKNTFCPYRLGHIPLSATEVSLSSNPGRPEYERQNRDGSPELMLTEACILCMIKDVIIRKRTITEDLVGHIEGLEKPAHVAGKACF